VKFVGGLALVLHEKEQADRAPEFDTLTGLQVTSRDGIFLRHADGCRERLFIEEHWK
jgi:hypothetical protein